MPARGVYAAYLCAKEPPNIRALVLISLKGAGGIFAAFGVGWA